jgi:hypothetical protein
MLKSAHNTNSNMVQKTVLTEKQWAPGNLTGCQAAKWQSSTQPYTPRPQKDGPGQTWSQV